MKKLLNQLKNKTFILKGLELNSKFSWKNEIIRFQLDDKIYTAFEKDNTIVDLFESSVDKLDKKSRLKKQKVYSVLEKNSLLFFDKLTNELVLYFNLTYGRANDTGTGFVYGAENLTINNNPELYKKLLRNRKFNRILSYQ